MLVYKMRSMLRVYLYFDLNLITKTVLYIKMNRDSQRYAFDMPVTGNEELQHQYRFSERVT
jgi:hypothetical protein